MSLLLLKTRNGQSKFRHLCMTESSIADLPFTSFLRDLFLQKREQTELLFKVPGAPSLSQLWLRLAIEH